MRTTVDLKEDHRAVLHAIAVQRGWRGYSRVIEEAIECYLAHHHDAAKARAALLERRGAWSSSSADQIRAAIETLRQQWDAPAASS